MDRGKPTSSIEAIGPNDFAHLSNEIIHNAVDSHRAEKRNIYNQKLLEIDGPWGEFSRELSACTEQLYGGQNYASVLFCSRVFDRSSGDVCKRQVSYEEIQNRFVCSSSINCCFGLDLLLTVAPKLYDVINFYGVPDTHCKALGLMGTRFTKIWWSGNDPKKAATPELVNFLRRQLLSNYLRMLYVYDVKFENGAFDDQIEVLVKKQSFECLSMGAGSYPVPFQIFKEAYKTWQAPKAFEFENRALCVRSSRQTTEKLEEYFKTKFEINDGASEDDVRRFVLKHPEHSTAKMCVKVCEEADNHRISMNFYGL